MLLQSSFASLLLALSAPAVTNAWFRVPCSSGLVRERIDPIQAPGKVSAHVHHIHGGINFGKNVTFNTLRQSSCTSCQVQQDLSNYWTPLLYFKDPATGKFEAVGNGGLLVYYQNRGAGDVFNGGTGLKAFPPGFRMISGDPYLRTKKYAEGQGSQAELRERAIKWACLRYSAGQPGYESYGFPTTDCESGFQARLHMPACWDGVNIDSADHRSHVAHLSIIDNGTCPPSHPVYLMKMFYEITWDVTPFKNRWAGGKWPFVWANGDPTGYGMHGDFFNGWDVAALQNAIDKCNSTPDQLAGKAEACPFFNMLSQATVGACKKTTEVNEVTSGPLAKLPGCNPLQAGPADAIAYTETNCPV